MKMIPLLIISLLFVILTVQADSTQQFNKIYLNPFYRPAMLANTNYTYTLNVNPPDRISQITSAIIGFDVYMTPSVNFTLFVNGRSCNTGSYYISTTFASAGQARLTFDCSNIINSAGNYNIILRSTNPTSSITGWIDLVYMNNPSGTILLHGTEYIIGENGKMFLQFLDNNNQAINNSECFLSLWYPDNSYFLNETLMNYLSDGIYYKNFLIPNIEGVYPASAKCYVPLEFGKIIKYSNITENWESNTWTGGTGWYENEWDRELTLSYIRTNATAGTGGCYNGIYCGEYTGGYGYLERGAVFHPNTVALNLTFSFKFLGFQTNEQMEFWIFDGAWHRLDYYNNANYTNGVWYRKNYTITESMYNLETLLLGWFGFQTPSTSDKMFFDDFTIDVVFPNITISNTTEYQILRGSGEVHVSELYSKLNMTIINASLNASDVWNYPARTLTDYNLSELKEYILNISAVSNSNYALLQIIDGKLNVINASVNDISSTANNILYLSQQINSTSFLILNYAESLNSTVSAINSNVSAINSNVNSIKIIVEQLNLTVNQINELSNDINSSIHYSILQLNQINATLNDLYNLALNCNSTYPIILGYLNDINGTVYRIEFKVDNLTFPDVLAYLSAINITQNQILNAVLNINLTQEQQNLILDSINSTVNLNSNKLDDVLVYLGDINVTVSGNNIILTSINQTANSISTYVVSINTTVYQNQQLLFDILDAIEGNATIIMNVSAVNITAIVEGVLQADVVEYAMTDSTTTYGTGVRLAENPTGSFLGGVAYASPNDVITTCSSNDTLVSTLKSVRCVNGNCVDIERNSSAVCQYGCNSEVFPNECNASPFQTNFFVVIILLVIIMIVAVAIYKFK